MYHNGPFSVGAAYVFSKNSEVIESEQAGSSEFSYYAFLDKGMMYGTYSVWDGSGVHLAEEGYAYTDYDESLLFHELGITPNWEKIRYYILLDELF